MLPNTGAEGQVHRPRDIPAASLAWASEAGPTTAPSHHPEHFLGARRHPAQPRGCWPSASWQPRGRPQPHLDPRVPPALWAGPQKAECSQEPPQHSPAPPFPHPHIHRGKAYTEAAQKRTSTGQRGTVASGGPSEPVSKPSLLLSRLCATWAPVLPVPSLPATCTLPARARGTALPQAGTKCFLILRARTTKATHVRQTHALNAGTPRTSLTRCLPRTHRLRAACPSGHTRSGHRP